MNAEPQLIDLLGQSTMFQTYQRNYTEATGLPLTLRPVETWQLPLHGKRRENAWCALMAGKSGTCSACLQMQERLTQTAGSQPATLTCAYGLSETVVPVVVGQRPVGYLQTGQVMLHKPADASFKRALRQSADRGVHLDEPAARDTYFNTPVVPAKRMEAIQGMLSEFADHLALTSNQILVQREHAEPPSITRARQFIEQHLGEDLSLGMVAHAVNASIFYFCKLFKKSTGLTFTEFLNRRRVEKAKNLLLNRNLRISEIAYESGFQSLTHFNRMFRKILGESPSDFRHRLPAS
jgi:AraC-like DNA-binding protein